MLRAIPAIWKNNPVRRYHKVSTSQFGYRGTRARPRTMDPIRYEVIEDSEPERQENWRREREERMKLKAQTRLQAMEVIELSDTETSLPAHPPKTTAGLRTHEGKTVISISDDSLTAGHAHNVQDIPPNTSPSCSSTSNSADSSSISFNVKEVVADIARNKQTRQGQDCGSESDSEDETSAAFRNGIGQFAFSSKPSGTSTTRLARTTSDSVVPPVTKGARAKSTQATFLEFSEVQLSDLRKCVSCDIKWTTRKSGVQKIAHIKTCAKKALMTDDTLKLLITREIEITQAEKSKSSKNPPFKEPELPKTFIENVLIDGGIQKTKKNAKATSSLKRITESRNTILEKATAILGPQSVHDDEQGNKAIAPPSTQPLTPSLLAANVSYRAKGEEGMPTQPIGHSALATRFGRATTEASGSHSRNFLSSAQQLPESLEPPPPTQNFAPSRLGSLQRTRSLFHLDSSPNPIHNDPDLLMDMDAISECTPVNDDAILIYDPDALPPRTPSPSKYKDKHRKRTTAKPKSLNLNSQQDEAAEKVIDDDAELARQLKDVVLADEELYLRILRYEPIHFNTFMEMAKNNRINAVALRSKMRTFLDTQAISHYGSEPGGSRSRN